MWEYTYRKEVSSELKDLAKSMGIDLDKIDTEEAGKIFENMPSLSREIKKQRYVDTTEE
jgi:hypothetical protein